MTTIYVTRDTNLPARRDNELYPTERPLIRAALKRYALAKGGSPGYILDPGAGDGRWGQAAKALYPGAHLAGVELRDTDEPEGFDYWLSGGNFLEFDPWLVWVRYNLICGNPPYGPKVDGVILAEHFIRHGFDLLAPGGRMIYLLPLQLQAGKDRYNNLWVTHPPTLVAVVSPRPSFGLNMHGRRGTNGTDYGLFVWDKTLDGMCAGTARRWATELFSYEVDRVEAATGDTPTVAPQAPACKQNRKESNNMDAESKVLPDEVIYDLLHQLPLAISDDHAQDIPGVYDAPHGLMSLQELLVDWIYDQLKQPDAPEVDYDDPDFDEILGYLDANIPTYIEALSQWFITGIKRGRIPMTNQPNIDPALRDRLAELAELAREIGAERVWIIRGVLGVNMLLDLDTDDPGYKYIRLFNSVDGQEPPAGLLVILRFPASDGGPAGMEVK